MTSSTPEAQPRRFPTAALFAAVFLIYLSLSPGFVGGMGYTVEEINATRELFTKPLAYLSGADDVAYSRNGPVPLFVHAPFYWIGGGVSRFDPLWIDRVMAFEPVLLSALLVTIIFVWARRLTGSAAWSLLLALGAGFATMIWPYAYIGLETTQSLFLLVAAWIALESPGGRSWPRTIGFALVCAVAVTAKSTGTFLLPAVFFLIWRYFAPPDRAWTLPVISAKSLVTVAIVGTIYIASSHYRSLFWADYGGTANFIKVWLAPGPLSFFLNLVSFLFSANKGLIVFAPLTLISLYFLPRVLVTHRWLVVFALLTLGGLAGGFSLLRNWADETWGPRYLHSAVAPLILIIAAARSTQPFRIRREAPLLAAIALGSYVSFLGAFFFYGIVHAAQHATSQQTLEGLQHDPVWNHIRFNDRLLQIWLASDEPPPHRTWWTAEHRWFFAKAKDAPGWKSVNLAPHAQPQSAMIRTLEAEHRRPVDAIWLPFYLACAIAGAVLMLWVIARALRAA